MPPLTVLCSEKLLEKLADEFGVVERMEAKNPGPVSYSMYSQSLMEICYQLHSIAPLFALELPKKIEQLADVMILIQSIQKSQKPPKSAFKSINRSQTHSTFGRYLVIVGIPKIMTENEFTLQLKRSLAILNGLKVIEIKFIAS